MDYSARVRPRTSVYHSLREAGGGVATGAVESLPDELLLLILSKAASAAASPVDLANFALTSPRFARLVREPPVRSRLPLRALVPSARLWARPPAISAGDTNSANTARDSSGAYGGERNTTVTDSSGGGGGSDKCRMACRFLLQCGLAGCTDALYVLGMIKFYCHRDFWAGASLLVWAAEKGHVAAICSLAIIHSHGSGGGSSDGNPAAATDILWHAARAGSKQALQELGHCYLDGHGVPQRTLLGARLLLAAMCPALAHSPHSAPAVQSAAVGLQLQRIRAEAREASWQSHRGQEMAVQVVVAFGAATERAAGASDLHSPLCCWVPHRHFRALPLLSLFRVYGNSSRSRSLLLLLHYTYRSHDNQPQQFCGFNS
ncbi:unnamed protein product [Closterium sp. NIES-65]|nr:unnamed protein product [Closterium sp. NIES-65]